MVKVKSWLPLQTNWTPPRIHFREKQFEDMKEAFAYEGATEHLFLSGGRGVGKTATTKIFSENLHQEDKPTETIFIYCQPSFPRTLDGAFPDWSSRKRALKWVPSFKHKKVLIVFDDISILSKPAMFGNYLTSLYDQLERYEVRATIFLTSTIPLVVTNERYWPRTTNSRFQFKSIPFDPYKKEELYKIAMERLRFALDEKSFTTDVDEEGIGFLIEKVLRHSSDVRLLLELLEASLKFALKNDYKILDIGTTQSAWEIEKENYWADTYRQLPAHRAYLLWLYFGMVKGKRTPSSSELYELYKSGCEKMGVRPHKERMLRNYMRDLIDEGFLQMHIHRNKSGTTTELNSDLQPEMMVEAGRHIDWVSRFH